MAISSTLVGKLGGGVTQTTLSSFTNLVGNNDTFHQLGTVVVPPGEVWLVTMILSISSTYTGATASNFPRMTISGKHTTIFKDDMIPSFGIVAGPGTHPIGITTNSSLAAYSVSGAAGVFTAKT